MKTFQVLVILAALCTCQSADSQTPEQRKENGGEVNNPVLRIHWFSLDAMRGMETLASQAKFEIENESSATINNGWITVSFINFEGTVVKQQPLNFQFLNPGQRIEVEAAITLDNRLIARCTYKLGLVELANAEGDCSKRFTLRWAGR